jgi:hypothetical protein
MTTHYLYKITNLDKGKSYIGVTKTLNRRIAAHLSGNGSVEIAKDLDDTFKATTLVIGMERYIYDLEPKVISLYNTIAPYGYNLGSGGEGGNVSNRQGVLNTQAILSESSVIFIREQAAKGVLHEDLAAQFSVTRETISTLVRGDSWKSVGGPITRRKKVTSEDIEAFKKLRSEGLSIKKISEKTNWSHSTVWKYLK